MTIVIIPVFPNRAEAWRRFIQELQGSQGRAFRNWCRQLELFVEQVWLHETPGGTSVVVNLTIGDREAVLDRLAKMLTPFEQWLRQQILMLHGLDLETIAQATSCSATPFFTTDVIDINGQGTSAHH